MRCFSVHPNVWLSLQPLLTVNEPRRERPLLGNPGARPLNCRYAVNPSLSPTFRGVRDSLPAIALFRCSRQLNPDLWGTLGQFIPGIRSKPVWFLTLGFAVDLWSGINRLRFDCKAGSSRRERREVVIAGSESQPTLGLKGKMEVYCEAAI